MDNTTPSELITRFNSDMRDAVKGRRINEANALKSLLAALSNAEAVGADVVSATLQSGNTETTRKTLSVEDIYLILDEEIEELLQTLAAFNSTNDYTLQLEEKLAVLQRYK